MNHCKDCKHWNTEEDAFPGPPPTHGTCVAVVRIELSHHASMYPGQPIAVGHGGYEAEFWTPPGFGCVLWEAK